MRIAVGQLSQETNTFNPLPTTRADYESFGIFRAQELVQKLADVNEPGGFLQEIARWPERPQPIGLVRYTAWPSGPASAELMREIFDEMRRALELALPVDGVYLALHGALVAENLPDVEGALLEMMRGVIGPRVPLVASLDLHANITRQMV